MIKDKEINETPCNAMSLIEYLNANRKKKMNFSNMECEDLEKAWKSNDWAKVIRYIKKYLTEENC